jgi:hypothetical protein
MTDIDRRGFLATMLASVAAPSVLYRKPVGAAELPSDLTKVVPGDEEVVAYEDGPVFGETKLVVCASVKVRPLRLERGHGIKYLAQGPDRSVYLYFRDAAPRANCFLVPRNDPGSEPSFLMVCGQTSNYVRVGAYRPDGTQTSVDFDMLLFQHG